MLKNSTGDLDNGIDDGAFMLKKSNWDALEDYKGLLKSFKKTHFPYFYRKRYSICIALMLISLGLLVHVFFFSGKGQIPLTPISWPIIELYIMAGLFVLGALAPMIQISKQRKKKIISALGSDPGLTYFIKARRAELLANEKSELEKVRDELRKKLEATDYKLTYLVEEEYDAAVIEEFMERT